MPSAFLTGSQRTKDDRRAANCLMTVLAIAVVSPPAPARADEPAPPSLIERGLRHAFPDTPVSDRSIAASGWIPELRLKAVVEQGAWPGVSRVETIVFGVMAWPLGRNPVGDTFAGARDRRQRSAARDSLVERIAAAWHKRTLADDAKDDIAAQLAEEEADATIDALVGDDAEDGP